MVDEIVTRQELIDAKRDAQDLGKAVNEKVIVSPRYGDDFKSLPMITEEFQDAIETAAAAGAGANGWTDLLIQTADGSTQRAKNSSFQSQIDNKASTAYVDAQDVLKADKSYVDAIDASLQSQINGKASAAYLDNALTEQTQTVNTALSNLSTAANKFYPTLALANADIANLAVNQPVTVGEEVNGGLWYKATSGATSLTKSDYDPLTQAKNYADANPKFKSRFLVANENLNDLPEGVFFASTVVTPTLINFPAAEMTDTDGGIIFCDKAPNGSTPYQKVIRYTAVGGHIEEFDRIGNGGAPGGSFAWLPWKKKVSTKDVEDLKAKDIDLQNQVNSKPNINCFKNTALTSDGAFLHEASVAIEDGYNTATMLNTGVTSIFYDYDIDSKLFKQSGEIRFSVEMISDQIGSLGGDISIIAYKEDGAQTGSTVTTRGTVANAWETLTASMTLPPDAVKFRLRLIRRNGNTFVKFRKPVLVSSAWEASFVSAFSSDEGISAQDQYFVSKTGNNANDGSKEYPFLTIKKAIDTIVTNKKDGRVIILDSEWYRESVDIALDAHVEIVAAREQRAKIFGSDQLVVTKTTGYSKVYQAPLATKPVGMGGTRGQAFIAEWGTSYSVILDEDVHSLQRGETHRLPYTPMFEATSLAELDTLDGNGKWWWDSGVIYFAATDGSDATLKQYEAKVRTCLTHSVGSIYLRGVDSYFSTSSGMGFSGRSTVRDDCRVYGAYHNGFSDDANSTMSRRDMSLQNGNDGFNGTVTSYATENLSTATQASYFDPYSALNGDDGISFHIRGTCNIWGGLFEYNTKAGVVHVTGGGGNCYGTIARGQTNGFYTATPAPDGRNKSSMHCHNTIAEKNTYDYRAANADLYCVGTYSDNPTDYGYFQTSTGKVVVKNAKYRGDPAKMKSGNVVVENFETVT